MIVNRVTDTWQPRSAERGNYFRDHIAVTYDEDRAARVPTQCTDERFYVRIDFR
jgi:hypothetical protein